MTSRSKLALIIIVSFVLVSAASATSPSAATQATIKANQKVLTSLPFNNKADFKAAQRGFIGKPESLNIKTKAGVPVWNMDQYISFEGVGTVAPVTVNPSLWRQAQLNNLYGLFKVTDGIYQVRGYDLSAMSIIRGKTGYIVIDPLLSAETAKAAMDLVYEYLPKKPIVAVIYTHSHIDHFGGVKGIVSEAEVKSGKVKIIAPKGFVEHSISENVMAGNAMARRAVYMYGLILKKGPKGQVGTGLGKTTSSGTMTLITPTNIITKTGQTMTIDGVKIVFLLAQGTEAPSEMLFYFPQFKALCVAEDANHLMHNLYTLRGAQVRDAQAWANALNKAIDMFGAKTQIIFATHHWPMWGNKNCITFLEKQRDMYKYIHDQTLRLANHGYTMIEIAEMLKLPQSLADEWYNRGYYGTLNHNSKAVYNKYLGWFDGNPANLHPLPPVATSKKYVEYMGGAKAVLKKARKDFKAGNYRWVAQVVNNVVFANPNNKAAKELLAKTYDQLGYQAESGPWRNFYLTAAQELRAGVIKSSTVVTASPDIIKAMPLNYLFDYMAIKLNGPKAEGKKITLNWIFPDQKARYLITVNNAVLNYFPDKMAKNADATITVNRATLNKIITGKITVKTAKADGDIKITGNIDKVRELFSLLDKFDFWFNIVTPNKVN